MSVLRQEDARPVLGACRHHHDISPCARSAPHIGQNGFRVRLKEIAPILHPPEPPRDQTSQCRAMCARAPSCSDVAGGGRGCRPERLCRVVRLCDRMCSASDLASRTQVAPSLFRLLYDLSH
eukprot:3932517-Rhodomonas_salina.2